MAPLVLSTHTGDPFNVPPITAIGIVLGLLILGTLIRGQLVHTRRSTLIDLTNDVHSLTNYATPYGERDRAYERTPANIRRLQWSSDGWFAQCFAVTTPAERAHDTELIATARRALARHAARYPTA